jgi:hypothetical protein
VSCTLIFQIPLRFRRLVFFELGVACLFNAADLAYCIEELIGSQWFMQ